MHLASLESGGATAAVFIPLLFGGGFVVIVVGYEIDEAFLNCLGPGVPGDGSPFSLEGVVELFLHLL